MNFIIDLAWVAAHCALCIWIGLVVGQWANMPIEEWDKIDAMPWKDALAKIFRWSYWSIKRFFRKCFKLYPYNN